MRLKISTPKVSASIAALLSLSLQSILAPGITAQPAMAQNGRMPSPLSGPLKGFSGKQQDGPTYQPSGDNFNIYYATTRIFDSSTGTYGGLRNLDFGQGSTEFGSATMARPAAYQTISNVPNWMELRDQMAAADNYFEAAPIKKLSRESQATFFNRIRNFHGLIVVYVHGYDEPFDTALKEIAELANEYESRANGKAMMAIAYSWPSSSSTAAYSSDEASLEWSERSFLDFINGLNQNKASDSQLDLVAHSMGSRYAFNSSLPNFRNIFLSCSDVDFHNAEMKKDGVQKCVDRTLYVVTNDNDGALLTSQMLHKAPRLGRPIDPGVSDSTAVAAASKPGFLGANTGNLLNQAESMLGDRAVSMFGQKARTLVDQITSGRSNFTRVGQVSGDQSPEVTAWLAKDAYLSRDWGNKARLIDATGFITLNMGHRLAWPLLAGLMLDTPQDSPFTFNSIHKRPDAAMLKVMGGTPTYLYRFDRIDLSRLSR